MLKRISTITLFLGIFLMLASVVIALVSGCNANLIGGADWSAFTFYFGQVAWLAWLGACLTVVSLVITVLRK